MSLKESLYQSNVFFNLQFLANQIVEGFITGIHRSPFHGFSSEFAEHKVYNNGESTKHIDWKLFARTDKYYTKKYEDETNLRCHLIIDNSSSMHYPNTKTFDIKKLNKISFSALASAALITLLKKQRDAVGLSIYSENYDFYTPEKGSEKHHNLLMHKLEETITTPSINSQTNSARLLHEIAEKMNRRSLIVLFTDMFQYNTDKEALFNALQHLKHNKHEVLLFHTLDFKTELNFEFENKPLRFTDTESGEEIDLHPEQVRKQYKEETTKYIDDIKTTCAKYRIKYIPVDIADNFDKILNTYLIERQSFK